MEQRKKAAMIAEDWCAGSISRVTAHVKNTPPPVLRPEKKSSVNNQPRADATSVKNTMVTFVLSSNRIFLLNVKIRSSLYLS
ncbi:MAG: hypothetical protein ACTJHC_10070 [Vagococcus sp.]|uniref:hypothetical protein n=1 Tax=Marinilactibacillus psychrotolerans TaxID=191770 RepID=UPI001C7DA56B|nr:hypothetical protein [Marinilactibacillus psychrotolerans]